MPIESDTRHFSFALLVELDATGSGWATSAGAFKPLSAARKPLSAKTAVCIVAALLSVTHNFTLSQTAPAPVWTLGVSPTLIVRFSCDAHRSRA